MPNPQNIKPPKKGEIRNPKGRGKGTRNRSTIVKYWIEAIENTTNPITKKIEDLSQADLMTLAMIKKARKGDVSAYKELMDSAFGKITDKTELTGAGGKDLIPKKIEFVNFDNE
jgi:hypothetical protein